MITIEQKFHTQTRDVATTMNTFTAELWLAILGSITAVIVAFIAKVDVIIKHLRGKRQKLNSSLYSSDLITLSKSLQILEDAVRDHDHTGVHRAILFRGHNSSPQPKPPYYCDVIHPEIVAPQGEEKRLTQDAIRKKYSNIEVDSDYVQMLADAINSPSNDIYVIVEDMKDCLLKSIYESEGIKHSLVSFITVRGADCIYMTQSSFNDEPFSSSQIINARINANHMRQLMS